MNRREAFEIAHEHFKIWCKTDAPFSCGPMAKVVRTRQSFPNSRKSMGRIPPHSVRFRTGHRTSRRGISNSLICRGREGLVTHLQTLTATNSRDRRVSEASGLSFASPSLCRAGFSPAPRICDRRRRPDLNFQSGELRMA
jgi:hypothetical protein